MPKALAGVFGLAATLAACGLVSAVESFEEWERAQRAAAQRQAREADAYVAQQDRAFAQFLDAQWRAYRAFEARARAVGPKPRVVPQVPGTELPPKEQGAAPPSSAPVAPAVPSQPVLPDLGGAGPKVSPDVAPPSDGQLVTLDFVGTPVRVPVDARWREPVGRLQDGRDAQRFWARMSSTEFGVAVERLVRAGDGLALDDWGRVTLLQEFAAALRPGQTADQTALAWFFLIKSGMDARLGFLDGVPVLLVAMMQRPYEANGISVGQQPYYLLGARGLYKATGTIATYEGHYPGVVRPLDVRRATTGFAVAAPRERELRFAVDRQSQVVKVTFDQRLVDYLGRYPKLDFEFYFASSPGKAARRTLVDVLRPRVRSLDEVAAVDFLLAFVQTAFAYATDSEQFGGEKYFFAEEVLSYPFSDCEDRSVLFAWLVRELLDLEVIGLHYTGHVTTAVALNAFTRTGWKTVRWKSRDYVIADPTYVGARVGQAMPLYAVQPPLRVIPIGEGI